MVVLAASTLQQVAVVPADRKEAAGAALMKLSTLMKGAIAVEMEVQVDLTATEGCGYTTLFD